MLEGMVYNNKSILIEISNGKKRWVKQNQDKAGVSLKLSFQMELRGMSVYFIFDI